MYNNISLTNWIVSFEQLGIEQTVQAYFTLECRIFGYIFKIRGDDANMIQTFSTFIVSLHMQAKLCSMSVQSACTSMHSNLKVSM